MRMSNDARAGEDARESRTERQRPAEWQRCAYERGKGPRREDDEEAEGEEEGKRADVSERWKRLRCVSLTMCNAAAAVVAERPLRYHRARRLC